jgi:two-component system, chemotaxis family, sensor kinase CheA
MHLIRNCLDHGIESPETSISKGKHEQGTITMSAYNSGNNVFIVIADDGFGIDVEKVRQKAIDK